MSTDGTCPRCGSELEAAAGSVEMPDGERVPTTGVECPDCDYTDY